jgi:hypothetical protein
MGHFPGVADLQDDLMALTEVISDRRAAGGCRGGRPDGSGKHQGEDYDCLALHTFPSVAPVWHWPVSSATGGVGLEGSASSWGNVQGTLRRDETSYGPVLAYGSGPNRPMGCGMSIIKRATRSRAARVTWGALTVLCLVGVWYAHAQQAAGPEDAVASARARADEVAAQVGRVVKTDAGAVTFPDDAVRAQIRRAAADDAAIGGLVIWNSRGEGVAALGSTEPPGTPSRDPALTAALDGNTTAQAVRGHVDGAGDGDSTSTERLLRAFAPIQVTGTARPAGVVQIDFLYGALDASGTWSLVTRVLGMLALVFGTLFVLSLARRPGRRRGKPAQAADASAPPVPAPRSVWVSDSKADSGVSKASPAKTPVLPAAAPVVAPVKEPTRSPAPKVDPVPTEASKLVPTPEPAREDALTAAQVDAAMRRIEHLEGALKRASEEAEAARSRTVPQEELERVRREADERVAALERKLQLDGPEVIALRAQVAEAESRANEAESLLATAQDDLAAARAEVGEPEPVPEPLPAPVETVGGVVPDVDAGWAANSDIAPDIAPDTAPDISPEVDGVREPDQEQEWEPTDVIDLLEALAAKVAKAEARAQLARDEALQLSPEAADLRRRLARTAARKKLGTTG